ncbi:MAG: hypothetical protein GY757_21330, partial [bacterium]|nr:hypothetical protein [bacterium]
MAYGFEITSEVYSSREPESGGCTAPPAHTGSYTIYEAGVYLWLDWYGYKTGKVYKYQWISPSGELVKTYENTRTYDSNGCTWAHIDSQQLLDKGPGSWTVRFYYDNTLYYTGSFTFEDPGVFTYMHYKPASFTPGNGIFISVHGSGYNPVSYYHYSKDIAETNGVLLLVPYFNKADWNGYQRVFTSRFRADLYLQNMIDTVAAQTGADKTRLYIYGQSGGGQFVHRYLLAHPGNIVSIVISSPGWWTVPRLDWSFPYGFGYSDDLPDEIRFDLDKVHEVKKKVILGELDTIRDDTLNQTYMADFQGLERVQRSAHWVNRMNKAALDSNQKGNLRYEIIPGAAHVTVREISKPKVNDFLFNTFQEPPLMGGIGINNDADYTSSKTITLNIRCNAAAGAGKVAVSETPIGDDYANYQTKTWSGTAGEDQHTTFTYTFSGENTGTKFIFCRLKDQNENSGDCFGDAIYLTDSQLEITAPNGGETILTGTVEEITWTTAGNIENVTLEYSTDNGYKWEPIAQTTPNDGEYDWTPPGSQTSTESLVRISNAATGIPSDMSDAVFTITPPPPAYTLNREELKFGGILSGETTGAQTVIISTESGTLSWTAATEATWLGSTPETGTGTAEIAVTVDSTGLAAGDYNETVTITAPGAANSPQTLAVGLKIKEQTQDQPPFGEWATPTEGEKVEGSVGFTGWVLDDIEVERVAIYSGDTYIGDAVFVEGARMDVAAAYPEYPLNYRAGWGYMMLTNFLPGGGNGTYGITVKAIDVSGRETLLDTRSIEVDNAASVKPFGAVDTPLQGGTASGRTYPNHGWALTPQPAAIPTGGTTIRVWVNGVALGNPTYNQHRPDILQLMPGYNNSDGAG